MKKTILAYGEFLWDILPDRTVLGGAPFNFTCRLHALGRHAVVASKIGSDDLGQKALDKVKSLNLDTSCLQIDTRHPTGTVPVSFDPDHNPIFHITPNVAFDHIELTASLEQTAVKAECVCFGTLCQRGSQSRSTLHHILDLCKDSLKVLDINLRKDCYTTDTIESSLARANVLKCNEEEIRHLADIFDLTDSAVADLSRRLLDRWSLDYCLVTLGPYGGLAAAQSGTCSYDPGYEVRLRDAVGAGDAFTAGFVHKWLAGASPDEALAFANILGAFAVRQSGGSDPVTLDQIEDFTSHPPPRSPHPDLKYPTP